MATIKLPQDNATNYKRLLQYFHNLCKAFMFADVKGKLILKEEIHRAKEGILFYESMNEGENPKCQHKHY